jgi:spermidine/putrescine transport system ATP-binding protein
VTSPRASLEIAGLSKRFAEVIAVDGVTLAIGAGELFSLLGPSGCGKTTLLRLIAGLEAPTTGTLRIGGADLTAAPAHRRPVNLVFQHYALFPHFTVAENVGFGLRYQTPSPPPPSSKPSKPPRPDRRALVAQALALVRLENLGRRYPHEISGGQRQRVALARALVLSPQVLLLDEPLAALDRKLRKEMQQELRRLQRTLGITFVFVTHDQEEALAMSDRIAVMNRGRVEQIGTPAQIFERPSTAFVAEFMGAPNFWTAEVRAATAEGLLLALPGGPDFLLPCPAPGPTRHPGDLVNLVVRPEKLTLRAAAPAALRSTAPAAPASTAPAAASSTAAVPATPSSAAPAALRSAAPAAPSPAAPAAPAGRMELPVTVEERVYQGASTLVTVRDAAGARFVVQRPAAPASAGPVSGPGSGLDSGPGSGLGSGPGPGLDSGPGSGLDIDLDLGPGRPALLGWDPADAVLLREP